MFSSQVPLPSFLDDILKFVEVHHEFLTHCWSHDNKLRETNCLTTYPLSCLFSRFVKYNERENVAGSAFTSAKITAMACNKLSFNMISLLNQYRQKGLLNEFFSFEY